MNHESASGGSANLQRQLRFDGPPEGEYLYRASLEELESIRTKPGRTATGRPFDWMVRRKVARGEWRLECVRADILGLERPLEIYRFLADAIDEARGTGHRPIVALCKESQRVRSGLRHELCNCE